MGFVACFGFGFFFETNKLIIMYLILFIFYMHIINALVFYQLPSSSSALQDLMEKNISGWKWFLENSQMQVF